MTNLTGNTDRRSSIESMTNITGNTDQRSSIEIIDKSYW